MSSYTGISPKNPSKYVGPAVYISSIVSRNREPTGADYRQPETGKLYPIGSYWILSKNPTTGTEGDLWYLSKIVANVAYWLQISSGGSGTLVDIEVDTVTAPGVNPVTPILGQIDFHGAVVPNHLVPVETRSRALHVMNLEVQYATFSSATDGTKSGLAHFNSNDFSVDANGFVSLSDSQSDTGQTIGLQTINLSTIPLGAAGTYFFESRVAAYEATGPNAGGFSTFTTIRTNGVTATLIGDTDAILHTETAIMSVVVEMVASGNNAILQVTGVTGLTIDWAAETYFTYRG